MTASISKLLLLIVSAVLCHHVAHSFTTSTTPVIRQHSFKLSMSTDVEISQETTAKGLLKRDRYVATNRFAVRKGKAAKFEKRWATRKSRLATLDGFKYFHLMRRVTLNDDGTNTYDEGDSDETAAGNYVSFTIWNKKSDFSAWRSGEAFKEAHGGTSIGAFVSTMVNSALVIRGAPRPAFYDGLMLQSTKPDNVSEIVDGWRAVEADGINTLPTECFVACNQFFVSPENAAAFEKRWASRESKLKECDGFVAFSMLRRDASAKGHGVVPLSAGEPSYTSTTIWRDRKAFDNWRNGQAFKQAHGDAGKPSNDKASEEKQQQPPAPLWNQPPQPIFYEGTLVITSEDGA
jgi:heme-degrading monooxygenase HmoA